MIKILFYITTIFFSFNLYSQNYKSLKEKDSVYFYFDSSSQLEKKIMSINSKTKDTTYSYIFNEKNLKRKHQRHFLLLKKEYLTFDDVDNNKKADIKTITKRFLRKNKDIIIYPKDLEGENMKKILDSRNPEIIVYIIDVAKKKKRRYTAHEVLLTDGSFIEI